MTLTFTVARYSEEDMRVIMNINNRVMRRLLYIPEQVNVFFASTEEARAFLANSITVIVEFDDVPIAYLRYSFVKRERETFCRLGPVGILQEYESTVIDETINAFMRDVAEKNSCKYLLLETIEYNKQCFINYGYTEYASYTTGELSLVRLRKRIL